MTKEKFDKRIIAITGTTGSGKSALGDIAALKGAFIVDTDNITQVLQMDGAPGAIRIKAVFGGGYYKDGFLDRRALAREVFSNPDSLKKLNNIMHPLIYETMVGMIGIAQKELGYKFICALVPLLFEAGDKWLGPFDEVWLVTAPESLCLKRIMERDKLTEAAGRARIAAQMPLAQKLEAAQRLNIPVKTVENDGNREKLFKQAEKLLEPYKAVLWEQMK